MFKFTKKNRTVFIESFLLFVSIVVVLFSILRLPSTAYASGIFNTYSGSLLSAEDIAIYQSLENKEYKGEIAPAHLTVLGFTLGKSTINNVHDKLGIAEHYTNRNDGEEADTELYFKSNIKGDDTVVSFISGSSGGWEYLDGFMIATLVSIDTGQIRPRPSPLINRLVSTKSGLRLGMSPKELERIMGRKPSMKKGNTIYYAFHKTRMKGGSLYDIDSFVEAKFRDGKLVFLLITKTEFS